MPLARMPIVWAVIAFAAWYGLSITWSDDPHLGLEQLGAFRVLLTPWLLWPLIDFVALLVIALLLGVFASNIVQLLQAIDLLPPAPEGRLDGLLHAIQLGSWCAAALCWHLSAALATRGWWRWISLVGLAAAGFGLIGTGSRGPWIAAAIAAPACLITIAIRRRETRRFALVLALAGLLGAAAAWPIAGGMVLDRIAAALEEMRQVEEEADYSTSAGLRIGLWKWSWEIWQESPLLGKGEGSFLTELREEPEYAEAVARVGREIGRDHAHSTYLHTLAMTGIVGFTLLLAMLGLAVWRAARDPADHPYADGHLFVVVTWLIGAQFDCYHLNGHQFGLFAVVVAFTLAGRPIARQRAGGCRQASGVSVVSSR
jgi:O-antigen ligase